ncbi:uncharacterized protein [Littorina saxatilis]|uniref:Uncharacterized protein n=1 Tax=Littorina saxatilis TaxID=31220 RepID=A0AAN9BK77_9CAEN
MRTTQPEPSSSPPRHIWSRRHHKYSPFWTLMTSCFAVIVLLVVGVSGCAVEEECLGGRPHTPIGCCPVEGGDDCGTEVGVECDVGLGFQCRDLQGNLTSTRGFCSGRYGLRATAIHAENVTLQWEDFKAADYLHEYVLLYRKDSYSANQSSWEILDIGTRPTYTVTKLKPGTLYFMRVAVWADPYNPTPVLGNVSEVIWLTTQSVSHCSHNGEQFEVGQVTENCEDRCTCLATGQMNCTPLCAESQLPEVREGCSLHYADECSCDATEYCPDEQGEGCQYKDSPYADGAYWTDTELCTSCTCEGGHVSCHATCEEPLTPEDCVNPVRRTEENSCCEVIVCEPTDPVEGEEECEYNGTVYRLGDTFTTDCSLCMCVHGNSVNCSFASCPAIQLPEPSILCPFPHVQRDGCCDTVVCREENMDPQTLMSRLMAISFSPSSLTISFDVDHTTSQEASVTQDRYEVMTSDRGGDASSWTSRTYTPSTVDADDNASSPSDLLHNDAAIRVDDRVYITLGDLNPNTTYYVRVQPVMKSDMGVTEATPSNVTLLSNIVAKTMGEELTCQVDSKTYQEGAIVSETCREVCTCRSGHVSCESACAEESVIMAPSPTCPRPQLVSSQHSCCKTWKCFPEENGCAYEEIFLKNGEQVYEGSCDRRCKCTDGDITCTPVCLPAAPPPRTKCVLANVTGTCCPVWMCPQESKSPVEVSLATQVGYRGSCSNQETFKSSMKKAFTSRLSGHLPCADRESPFFVTCWVMDVVVTCPLLDISRRRRRQTTEIYVIAIITANITESNTLAKIRTSLNATESALSTMFSKHDVWVLLDDGRNLTSSGQFQSFGVSLVCDAGFIYKNDACVPENLFSPSTSGQRYNVSMALVNSSYDSATFAWSSLSPNSRTYVIGFFIQYRETTSEVWNQTVTLDPNTTRHTVTYLRASRPYKARLVALTKWASQPHMPLSMVMFTTKNNEVLSRSLTMEPLQVSLGLTSVTITWATLPGDVADAITKILITYRKSRDTGNVSSCDVDPRQSDVNLVGLTSATAYVTKFVIILVDGSTITTRPLHFVTMAEDSSDELVVPLIATCAVLVSLSVLLVVAFIAWRRMRRKSSMDTAFENKAYGVNITSLCSTRAKNESARPQDLEGSGSAATDTTGAGDCRLQA